MVVLGWNREFVTRRFVARVEVVERISGKTIKMLMRVSSVVLAIMLVIAWCSAVLKKFVVVFMAIDSTMPKDSSAGWSFFITIVLYVVAICIIGLVLKCHKKAMDIAFEEACRAHEKVMDAEIFWLLSEDES